MNLFDKFFNGKNGSNRNNSNNNNNNNCNGSNEDEIILLPSHMEIFDFNIDSMLYDEQDIIAGLDQEYEDYIECELVFSRN